MARTGRPRAFDADDALSRARDLFWARGYGATSIQDLVGALAIQRGSLYAAFGDKHRLYLKAVQLYATENRRQLETLLSDGPVLPALRSMLLNPAMITGAPERAEGRRGCLVGNTTAELAPGDHAARTVVANAYIGFIEVVTAALGRAQANGEVTTSSTPQAQAALLLLLFQGTALVARAYEDRDALTAGIDAALDGLRPESPTADAFPTGSRSRSRTSSDHPAPHARGERPPGRPRS